ncbi:hypothetical protein GCM10011581_49170 [Saccharopolyspora subtropica]|uniref:DUF4398 domain-containing protein n=1 Tax=Saccharopolyspora thermophila TaxID=89367 RepID=A0A917NJZ5_9PSEU|nr:hypothetical protein GCM10011581_49170 [Saccharopolyspora subtropica]
MLAALSLLLAGCGAPEPVDPQVRQELTARVDAVKAAALANDRVGAEAALAELHREIADAQAQGKLSPGHARTILAAAERVAEDVRTIPPPGPPAPVIVTVTQDPPAVEQPAEQDAKNREKAREELRKQREEVRKQQEGRGNNGKNDD